MPSRRKSFFITRFTDLFGFHRWFYNYTDRWISPKLQLKFTLQIGEIKNQSVESLKRAIGQMVVYHTGGLHVRIADSGAEELESAFFHILAYRI